MSKAEDAEERNTCIIHKEGKYWKSTKFYSLTIFTEKSIVTETGESV